jgi:hypothetical protein
MSKMLLIIKHQAVGKSTEVLEVVGKITGPPDAFPLRVSANPGPRLLTGRQDAVSPTALGAS